MSFQGDIREKSIHFCLVVSENYHVLGATIGSKEGLLFRQVHLFAQQTTIFCG